MLSRYDSWQNVLTGIGTGRDKRTAHSFYAGRPLTPAELEELFHGDDMAGRAVGKIVEEALRKGVDLHAGDDTDAARSKDEIKRVVAELQKLEWLKRVKEAATWGRLFGGGIIFVGALDGAAADQPLVDERCKGVRFLRVMDRRDVRPSSFYQDALSPKLGQPETYEIMPPAQNGVAIPSARVHESRLIIFEGVLTSPRKRQQNGGWSLSVLQRMYEVLRDFNQSWSSVSHLMTDAGQGVYALKGFLELIESGDETDFDTRMRMIEKARSTAQALVIDADNERFERLTTSFAGLPDVIDRQSQRLAAAADMPPSKLFGIRAAGLNASGESDEDSWYDNVDAYRASDLLDPTTRIARLVARGVGVRKPEAITCCFPPLKQLSPEAAATRRKTIFEGDAIAIDKGIYIAEEVALARSKGGQFSADEPVIDLDVRRKALDLELDKMTEEGGDIGTGEGGKGPEITPSDQATITKVNEARASQGLTPLEGPDGELTIAEFKAKHEAVISAAAAAEAGKEGAAPASPPPQFPPGKGAPPPKQAPPGAEPDDDEDA
jgi:phage-related protein (TIGR01555 family)